MITLPSHILLALQPLDVFCFELFNRKFKKERNGAMARDYMEPCKIILAKWVDKALN
jgi:hypothetical protein